MYSIENQFLQVRRSSPTPPMAMTTPGPDTDIKISLSPFTSRLPKSLEVDRRLGLHQACKYVIFIVLLKATWSFNDFIDIHVYCLPSLVCQSVRLCEKTFNRFIALRVQF